jgi:phenylalanyl-tRNA synthetase beta chain
LFDLDADALFTMTQQAAEQKYRPISKFPTVRQDLALIVDEDVLAGKVQRLIEQTGGRNLAAVTLFDVYTGPPIPAGRKSLAYSLTFQSYKSTFTEEEISNLRGRIVARLNKEVGAVLRG